MVANCAVNGHVKRGYGADVVGVERLHVAHNVAQINGENVHRPAPGRYQFRHVGHVRSIATAQVCGLSHLHISLCEEAEMVASVRKRTQMEVALLHIELVVQQLIELGNGALAARYFKTRGHRQEYIARVVVGLNLEPSLNVGTHTAKAIADNDAGDALSFRNHAAFHQQMPCACPQACAKHQGKKED